MKAELIDMMGDDLTVVNAARVSFNKESTWEQVDSRSLDGFGEMIIYTDLSEKDRKLINYLAKHDHWTPFSHVMIQMRETVPIFVARQRFKHMVGFTYNEISRRYDNSKPEFYRPDAWRLAAENKKQGSSEETITHFRNEEVLIAYSNFNELDQAYVNFLQDAWYLYKDMVDSGVCPEQARMVLPQSMYTSYYVTGSLAAWARAYKLRSNIHAQKEIRDLAAQWNEIISGITEVKHSWQALVS